MSDQEMIASDYRAATDSFKKRRSETTLITGCMFSGKTTQLLNKLAACPIGSAIAIRHRIDDRYRTDAIVSHDGRTFPAVTIRDASTLRRLHFDSRVRLVVIDEVHFLDDMLTEAIDLMARRGLNVLMAGLNLSSWGEPFAHLESLADCVTRVVVRKGICARCGGEADHTQRLTPIVDGRMVGGPESYEPRCARCWTPPPVSTTSGGSSASAHDALQERS